MVPVLHPEEIDGLITMKEAIRVVEAGVPAVSSSSGL